MKNATNKIGIEAEFILRDEKDQVVIPPSHFDRDGFPVLGEIRGEPGETVEEIVTNFIKAKMKIEGILRKGYSISFEPITDVPLAVYKKAMAIIRDSEEGKDALLSTIMNIYNTDISDYSDQIIKNNKIQGCRASCGLHIHFSSEISDERSINERKYEEIELPIKILDGRAETTLVLFKDVGYDKKEVIKVRASQLNKPTVAWIVEQMDKEFFDRFAPVEKDRTKFRKPGFFELKEYGFEYRSLPTTTESLNALVEIVEFALSLLHGLDDFNYRNAV